jgi:nicotinamide mononucleotide adenylyltransferase
MDNLGKHIAQLILEGLSERTVAIYPGAFKPPHKGHLEVVQIALSKADEVIILISKADRNGVQVGQSLKIWELLLKSLGADASRVKIQVAKSESPVKDVYKTVEEFPTTKFLALYGKGESKRFSNLSKYPNVEIIDTGEFKRQYENISATNLRAAIKANDIGEISSFYPQTIKPQDIIDIIPSDNILAESQTGGKIIAMIGGATKPPTAGHFLFAKTALQQLPDIDALIINIGTQPRDGINQEQALRIWEIYKKHLSDKVEIRKMTNYTPIRYAYAYSKQHPDEKVILAIGTREGEEQDLIDFKSRTAKLDKDKFPNLSAIDIRTVAGNSGTKARAAYLEGNKEEFLKYIPKELSNDEKDQVWKIVNDKSIKENLESHAKYEIQKAGLDNKDADYEGMIGKSVLELMKVYAKQGHSGFSAQWTRELFNKLANYENLTPITSDPDEWENVREGADGEPLWQSIRNPALFSDNGGKTWWDVDKKTIKEGIVKGIKAYHKLLEMADKELKYWALHYDIFQKLNTAEFEDVYNKLKDSLKGEQLEALNYFYKIFTDSDKMKNLLENKSHSIKSDFNKFVRYIGEILEYCVKDLKIPRPEVQIINNDSYTKENKSFGGYFPGENKIALVIYNRNLSDVCRTLTHEIYHAYQDKQGILTNESGKDGSKHENEANSYAGKIMREFNRKYSEILTLKND